MSNSRLPTARQVGLPEQRRAPLSILSRVITLLVLFARAATAEDLNPEDQRFFEAKVRPLLVEQCLKCHAGPKPKGGLRLDSRDGWQQGGDSGQAIVPESPDDSLLIQAVRHQDGVSEMPPGKKLPDSAIQILEAWVRRGAPDPRLPGEGASRKLDAQDHWSFQPISNLPVPVTDNKWSRTSIDRFIEQKHHAAGIRPVHDADRYTWLRRVTYDLTGLPPSVDEINAFIADDAPGFRERAVDRLLASPAFGEKWARHWLDLACYADTIGSASMPMRHAWRYRDYVISSLNHDKPLDLFVREQIAGDLLPAQSTRQQREQLIATGFLAIGPWQLAEQDKLQLRMDIVDHQITRIGTMFLGMTLDCARCHDHKFDPIGQDDYYAMAGLFANIDVLDGIWRSNVSAVVNVALPELPHEQRRREATAPQHAAEFAEAIRKWEQAKQTLQNVESRSPIDMDQVEDARNKATEAEGDWRFLEFHAPDLPRAHAVVGHTSIRNLRINLRGSPHALGDEIPRGFVAAIAPPTPQIHHSSSGRLELVDWLFSPENPLTSRVLANRIWAQMFGRGLVEPIDYFGVGAGSEQPTHVELLDHLALQLQSNWSLKRLVRLIALSRTYALSSSANETNISVDPENHLIWRAGPRRLDAEMIRDSVLLVSGQLQTHPGGPAIPLDRKSLRPGDLVNPPTIGGFEVPPDRSQARSIYQPVVRSYVHSSLDVLELFDMPSPNHIVGERVSTTVPTQALFLLNSPFMKDQAAELANSLLADSTLSTDEQRIERLWLRALGKPATDEHRNSALAQLNTADAKTAWARLCHAVLASNEFLFRR